MKFNSKHSVIAANLKTSSSQVRIILPYEVGTGRDGNIMALHKNYPIAIAWVHFLKYIEFNSEPVI